VFAEGGGAVMPLPLGVRQQGRLTRDEPMVRDDRRGARYELQLGSGGDLVIDLRSDAFDAYLYVTAPDGQLYRDDDGGDDRNSRLTIRGAEPGRYVIDVSSYGGDGSGSFELLAELEGGIVPVPTGAVVTQENAYEGARVTRGPDWEWGDQDGGAGTPGTIVSLDSSTANGQQWVDVEWDEGDDNNYRVGPDFFDLVFYTEWRSRDEFGSDDEYGDYIQSVLEPGMRVRAIQEYESVSEGETGTYYGTNSGFPPAFVIWEENKNFGGAWLDGAPRDREENAYWVPWHAIAPEGAGSAPAPGQVHQLQLGSWYQGELTGDETARRDDRRVAQFEVEVPFSGGFVADLRSDHFDCYLYVTTPDGSLFRDDDGGDERNSLIEIADAVPGRYLIEVSSYGGEEPGRFQLLVDVSGSGEPRGAADDDGFVVTEENVYEGARVVRGPDWEWEDQDGDGVGTIVDPNHSTNGGNQWVYVEWDEGGSNSYRIGPELFDLEFAGQ
jgi:hypothetical protein